MKKLIILLIVASPLFALAQSKTTKAMIDEIKGQWTIDADSCLFYQEVVEIPGISSDLIFQRAESYFVYKYTSGKDVIQTKDKDANLVIGKGLWTNFYIGLATYYSASHILRIDIKEEKARISLTVQRIDRSIVSLNGEPNIECSDEIKTYYPISQKTYANKNVQGKVFRSLHTLCATAINDLSHNLKNGGIKQIDNNNW